MKGRTTGLLLILNIWESFRPFALLNRPRSDYYVAGRALDRLSTTLAINEESDKGSYHTQNNGSKRVYGLKRGGNP